MVETRGSGKGGKSDKEDASKKEDKHIKRWMPKTGGIPKRSNEGNLSKTAPPLQEDDTPPARQANNAVPAPPAGQMLPPARPTPVETIFDTSQPVPSPSDPPPGIDPSTMITHDALHPLGPRPGDERPKRVPKSKGRPIPLYAPSRPTRMMGIKTSGSGGRRLADQQRPPQQPLSATPDPSTTEQQIASDRQVAEELERIEKEGQETENRLAAERIAQEDGIAMGEDPFGAAWKIQEQHNRRAEEVLADRVRIEAMLRQGAADIQPGQVSDFIPDAQLPGLMRSTQGPSLRVPQGDSMPPGFGAPLRSPPYEVSQATAPQAEPFRIRPGPQAPPNAYEMPPERAPAQNPPILPSGWPQSAPEQTAPMLPSGWPQAAPAHMRPPAPPTPTFEPIQFRPPQAPAPRTAQVQFNAPQNLAVPPPLPQLPINAPAPLEFYQPIGMYPAHLPTENTPHQISLNNMIPGERQNEVRHLLETRRMLQQSIRIMTSYRGRVMRPPGGENTIQAALDVLEEFLNNL